jgi:lysophospholipase L1-like esterase
MTIRRFTLAAGLGAALVAAGCQNDQLTPPAVPAYANGALFQRYVSMGNSITSGFQSGGIDDSTQKRAYPVLLAGVMGGDPFYYPSLAGIGCPPPYTNIFTGSRLGGGTGTTCFFRTPGAVPYISNVAVPSAEVLDIAKNGPGAGTNSNALTELFLGGRTQLQAMAAVHPTFVSVWIGNNDVLGAVLAANAGDSTLITPVATFQTEYQNVVSGVAATGAKAILIGVANVTEIPYVSQGATYWAIRYGFVPGQPGDTFPTADSSFHVDALCAPSVLGGKGDSILVPFPFGGTLLAAAAAGVDDTLHCVKSQTIPIDTTHYTTVQPAELRKLLTTVVAYNSYIANAATTNGWAYLDPNPVLDSLRANPLEVAPFPAFGAPCSTSPFGLAFSCDGFHPSAATHVLIARHLVQAINAKYSSAIPSP